jgi:hypothetical protein
LAPAGGTRDRRLFFQGACMHRNDDIKHLLDTILLRNGEPDKYWCALILCLLLGIALIGGVMLFIFQVTNFMTTILAAHHQWSAVGQWVFSLSLVAALSLIVFAIMVKCWRDSVAGKG